MNKKFIKILFLSGIMIFTHFVLSAQVSEIWKKNLNGHILWQQVNSFGNYLVCTNVELAAFNPNTGDKLWSKNEYANIPESQIEQLIGSPLMAINQDNKVSMIDPFSGDIKFNSELAGISALETNIVLFKSNGLLVAGKDFEDKPKMLMIDLSTAKTIWTINEKFGKIISTNELSKQELLVVTLFKVYKINTISGEIIWKNSTSAEAEQIESMGALGSMLGAMAEQMVDDMDFNLQFYKHPTKNMFIVGSDQKNERQSGSTTIVTYENSYIAFDIESGNRLWKKPISMKGQVGDLAFYEDGIIILPNDGSKTKINFFNTENPIPTWGKKGRGTNVKGGIYNSIPTNNGFILVSTSKDKHYLNYLDPKQGIITFEKPVRVKGELLKTIDTPKGLLYITTQEINILNPTTGTLHFEKSISCNPNLLQQNKQLLYFLDNNDYLIKTLNIETLEVNNITNEAIAFEGKENPSKFELREKGIFIASEQNVALFDYNGTKVFQEYYEAPREPGMKRALLIAQAARAAYIGANSYYAADQLQNAAANSKEDNALGSAIAQGFGEVYEELGDQATDFATQSIKQAFARYKATADGRDFMIILGKDGGNNALLKVNKNTGKIDGSINLGSQTKPIYAVDDITGQVFYKTSDTEITSYKL